MKKYIIILFTLLMFLTSCESVGIPENCLNTPSYCQIDGTVYKEFAATIRRYSNAFPEGNSLCFDPLCTHRDTLCTEFINSSGVVTDGKKLYIRSYSYKTYGSGTLVTSHREDGNSIMRLDAVYQLDFKTGEMKRLAEFAAANGLVTHITTDGEYVYYVEAFHKDKNIGEDSGTYGIPKRVPCRGGAPEEYLDGDYSAFAEVYADRENYYVSDEGMFTQINRETGEKISAPLPGVFAYGVIFHSGGVYLDGYKENFVYKDIYMGRASLWKWERGAFIEIVSDIDSGPVWDEGGVWYTKMLPKDEFVTVGSKEAYDGKGMSMYDFVRTSDGMLYYHDFATGEETVYSLGNENMKVEPICVSNGYIIASCNDLSELDFDYEKLNLKPEPDGTVSFHGAIKADDME